MKTFNAIIKATLGDLLEILDARTIVSIFIDKGDYESFIYSSTPVYELLSSSSIKDYLKYEVIGINKTLGRTSILIKEV